MEENVSLQYITQNPEINAWTTFGGNSSTSNGYYLNSNSISKLSPEIINLYPQESYSGNIQLYNYVSIPQSSVNNATNVQLSSPMLDTGSNLYNLQNNVGEYQTTNTFYNTGFDTNLSPSINILPTTYSGSNDLNNYPVNSNNLVIIPNQSLSYDINNNLGISNTSYINSYNNGYNIAQNYGTGGVGLTSTNFYDTNFNNNYNAQVQNLGLQSLNGYQINHIPKLRKRLVYDVKSYEPEINASSSIKFNSVDLNQNQNMNINYYDSTQNNYNKISLSETQNLIYSNINEVENKNISGNIYSPIENIKSVNSVNYQPLYTKPVIKNITLPTKVMRPESEINYITKKNENYTKRKTKVFVPTKIRKVFIPSKKIIYVQSPRRINSESTIISPRKSLIHGIRDSFGSTHQRIRSMSPIRISDVRQSFAVPLSPLRYSLNSFPKVSTPLRYSNIGVSHIYAAPLTPVRYSINSFPKVSTPLRYSNIGVSQTYAAPLSPVRYSINSIPKVSTPVRYSNVGVSQIYAAPLSPPRHNINSIPNVSTPVRYSNVGVSQTYVAPLSPPRHNINSIPNVSTPLRNSNQIEIARSQVPLNNVIYPPKRYFVNSLND